MRCMFYTSKAKFWLRPCYYVVGFWVTVTSKGSLCAYGTVVCLSYLSVMLVYCDQTVGWIKMPLGTEVCLSPGDILLDGDPAPPPPRKGHSSPTF